MKAHGFRILKNNNHTTRSTRKFIIMFYYIIMYNTHIHTRAHTHTYYIFNGPNGVRRQTTIDRG